MKRRDVLKAGVVAGAGLWLPRAGTRGQSGDGTNALNIALIGVGLQGRALVNAALPMKDIRFRAICDIWEYSRNYGKYYLGNYGHQVSTYADYRQMLDNESDLDAVLVASPDFVHAEQTNACLKAGVHVYCETMMSNTLTGARSMVQTMRETGKLLQIGYQRRSNPRYRHVVERLMRESKLLGKTTQAHAQWMLAIADDRGWPRRKDIPDAILKAHGYGSMKEFRNWRWYRKYTGGLYGNLAAHQLDVLNWFLDGRPATVMASGSGSDAAEGKWDKNVMALYEYGTDDGVVQASCQMLTSTRGDGTGSYEQFLGTQGSIKISQNPRWTVVFRDPDAPDWEEWIRSAFLKTVEQERARRSERAAAEVAETGEVEKYELPVKLVQPVVYPHLENFFQAIKGQATLTCPADVAYATEVAALKTVEAIAARKTLEFMEDEFSV